MSTTTTNLGLFKYDPVTDGKEIFSIQTALNDNWDILDTKAGAPETVVDGTTWYRRFTDGWKEQGGQVSLSETVLPWVQPALTSVGTIGISEFAVQVDAKRIIAGSVVGLYDKDASTSYRCDYLNSYGLTFIWYTNSPLNISRIYYDCSLNNEEITGLHLYGSNDGENWTDIGNATAGHIASYKPYFLYSYNQYYKYHKGVVTAHPNDYFNCKEIEITATYKTNVANSITFPVAFTNTNYSYTFANQDGGGMDAYVSNKTTTGMTLSNTNSGSASWTACGY